MQSLHSARPHAALQSFVRAYAQRTYVLHEPTTEPSLPSVDPVLVFLFGAGFKVCFPGGGIVTPHHATIVGANLRFGTNLRLNGKVDLFAIFFQPAGFTDLFGVPGRHITSAYHDASAVFGSASSLWEQLAEANSFAYRVRVAEAYLLAQLATAPVVHNRHAANEILSRRGMIRIRLLAHDYGVSVRQFERDFIKTVGATPKSFARVARFECALDAKIANPARTWLDIAVALGYSDQMHLIHDFKGMSGNSPEALLKILGDARPPALVASGGDDETFRQQ
jgi:AraC-like DNA-binding protein